MDLYNKQSFDENSQRYIEDKPEDIFEDVLDKVESYQALFKTELGKKVLDDILLMCGMVDNPMDGNLEFNVGRQNVGQQILTTINTKQTKAKDDE